MLKNKETLYAFTLAEVLLTLVIVGIVAALTIPSLLFSVQKQKLVSNLQIAHNILSQSTKMLVTDNNGDLTGLYNNSSDLINSYSAYIKFTRQCAPNQGIGECFPSNAVSQKLSGGSINPGNTVFDNTYRAIGINKICYLFISAGASCSGANYKEDGVNNSQCGDIYVDVNCSDSPNTLGRDIFIFRLGRYSIVANGLPGTNITPDAGCEPTNTGVWSGQSCAAKIMLTGWQMNY